jgi:hypothetical protein
MKRFSLGPVETGKLVRIIRIVFGLLCIAVAAYWTIFNLKSAMSGKSIWVTTAFLTGFGVYQIWAGLGRAERYIVIDSDSVILKRNSFLPVQKFTRENLESVQFYPMSMIFRMRDGKKTILRFGTVYADNIDPVKEAVEEFTTKNQITKEIISEEVL